MVWNIIDALEEIKCDYNDKHMKIPVYTKLKDTVLEVDKSELIVIPNIKVKVSHDSKSNIRKDHSIDSNGKNNTNQNLNCIQVQFNARNIINEQSLKRKIASMNNNSFTSSSSNLLSFYNK